MQIHMEMSERYEELKASQIRWDDPMATAYSIAIFCFAEKWADSMEAAMGQGISIPEAAWTFARDANKHDITESMYILAVSVLTIFWVHGTELFSWHQCCHKTWTRSRAGGDPSRN